MKLLIIYFSCILHFAGFSQAIPFAWAKSFGGPGSDYYATSITRDSTGNVYTCGYFFGTGDFDPGAGVFLLTSAGQADGYVTKMDPDGNFIWAKRFGGFQDDHCGSLFICDDGSYYLSGDFFSSEIDVDPGTGVNNLTLSGGRDFFIVKLNASGNFVSARDFGGTGTDGGGVAELDSDGNLIISGTFTETLDVDPGTGVYNLTGGVQPNAFIIKLAPNGTLLWAKHFSGYITILSSLLLDDNDAIYICGQASNGDLDPGQGTANLSAGNINFAAKLTASGDFVWAKQCAASASLGIVTVLPHIAFNQDGELLMTGQFQDSADLDPGSGTYEVYSAGEHDIFIVKLDTSGGFLWGRSLGGATTENALSLAVDESDNIYLGGFFRGTTDLNPSPVIDAISSAGLEDAFIAKYTPSGDYVWGESVGSINVEVRWQILVDDGQVFGTCGFKGTVDFAPGAAVYTMSSPTSYDVAVFKWGEQCYEQPPAEVIFSCGPYLWERTNSTYSVNGIYTDTITNTADCDSIFTLNLTISEPVAMLTSFQTICDTANAFVFSQGSPAGGIYTVNGTALTVFEPGIQPAGTYEVIYTITDNSCVASDTADLIVVHCSGLGLKENTETSVVVFPNPTSGMLQLSGLMADQVKEILLFDEIGRLMQTYIGSSVIDLSGCASGIYRLVISGENFRSMQKVSLMK